MPPKKTEGAAAPKAKSTSTHASYQDMITDAIVNLKDRNGSSRQSLKKYVKANNKITVTDAMFDSLFNKALRTGVDKGVFEQPKGASGGTKLAKKAAKPAVKKDGDKVKKPAAKKEPKEKKAAAPKKETKKAPAAKKETKKAAAPKKETKKAPAAKKEKAAPAVVDKPKALSKTKSGRVTKTTAAPAKKAAPKKAAAKKATPKKAEAAA